MYLDSNDTNGWVGDAIAYPELSGSSSSFSHCRGRRHARAGVERGPSHLPACPGSADLIAALDRQQGPRRGARAARRQSANREPTAPVVGFQVQQLNGWGDAHDQINPPLEQKDTPTA